MSLTTQGNGPNTPTDQTMSAAYEITRARAEGVGQLVYHLVFEAIRHKQI